MSVLERKICDIRGTEPGPTIISIGGIHGNEPAGIWCAERVSETIEGRKLPMKGRFVAFRGNLGALGKGVRFLDDDMNRLWIEERIQELYNLNGSGSDHREENEIRELHSEIEKVVSEATGPIYLCDLHTTSSQTIPYMWVFNDSTGGEFNLKFPLPCVYGVDKIVQSAFVVYYARKGYTIVCPEGGNHFAVESIDRLESILWLTLVHSGAFDREDVLEEFNRSFAVLDSARKGVPQDLEVFYHHSITPKDLFKMRPGYRNFDPVTQGQPLAEDRQGAITAPEDCRVLLPLYQKLGDDGYFLVRERAEFRKAS